VSLPRLSFNTFLTLSSKTPFTFSAHLLAVQSRRIQLDSAVPLLGEPIRRKLRRTGVPGADSHSTSSPGRLPEGLYLLARTGVPSMISTWRVTGSVTVELILTKFTGHQLSMGAVFVFEQNESVRPTIRDRRGGLDWNLDPEVGPAFLEGRRVAASRDQRLQLSISFV
jgi:hypothetical protein